MKIQKLNPLSLNFITFFFGIVLSVIFFALLIKNYELRDYSYYVLVTTFITYVGIIGGSIQTHSAAQTLGITKSYKNSYIVTLLFLFSYLIINALIGYFLLSIQYLHLLFLILAIPITFMNSYLYGLLQGGGHFRIWQQINFFTILVFGIGLITLAFFEINSSILILFVISSPFFQLIILLLKSSLDLSKFQLLLNFSPSKSFYLFLFLTIITTLEILLYRVIFSPELFNEVAFYIQTSRFFASFFLFLGQYKWKDWNENINFIKLKIIFLLSLLIFLEAIIIYFLVNKFYVIEFIPERLESQIWHIYIIQSFFVYLTIFLSTSNAFKSSSRDFKFFTFFIASILLVHITMYYFSSDFKNHLIFSVIYWVALFFYMTTMSKRNLT